MGFGPREITLLAALSAVPLLLGGGCGGSGESRRGASSAPGGFPVSIAQAESTFNPSDYGIESWESEEQKNRGEADPPAGDSALVASPDTIPGFRVQVTITEDIDYAGHLRDSLSRSLQDQWVYVVYHPPYYKIRVGNFGDRFEAAGMLETLKRRGFPDAWIVPDRVLRNPPSPLLQEEPLPPDTADGTEPPR